MNVEDFTTSGGTVYRIEIDFSGEEVAVYMDEVAVGTMSLRLIEGDPPYQPDMYRITNLALNGCMRQGVGRRCLQFHHEMFDAPIIAGNNDGTKSDDGSHLIDGGPGFIAKMRAEGLVGSDESNDFDRYDE